MIKFLIGCLLWIVDPSFRRLLRAKMCGGDDTVGTGENVIYILRKTDNEPST